MANINYQIIQPFKMIFHWLGINDIRSGFSVQQGRCFSIQEDRHGQIFFHQIFLLDSRAQIMMSSQLVFVGFHMIDEDLDSCPY